MNGLKLDPGWRQACVAWLNLFLLKSKPPTKARIEQLRGSSGTKAPSTSGNCVISQVFLGVLSTRIAAPGRILMFGGALLLSPDCAGFRPSPVISIWSPLARAATILFAAAAS